MENKKVSPALVAGIIAAGAVGYLLFGPQGKKNRKQLQDWMYDAKTDIVKQAKKVKAATKEEFGSVIDEVMKKYTELKKVSKKEVQDLKSELMGNWDQLSSLLSHGEYKEVKKVITAKPKAEKKVVKKAAKAKKNK